MSRIKELKENPDNSINIVKILSMFAPQVKNNTKYIETLIRVFQNDVILQNAVLTKRMKDFGFTDAQINDLNKHEKVYLTVLINEPENREAFKRFHDFCLYNEKNAIENKDLQSYNSFDDIFAEYKKAKHKEELKEMEKQIVKVIDDDNWLAIIPLTYEASLKYGASTRWCTAMKDNQSYYNNYSRDGILIYCLNKKTEKKFAGYCKVHNTSVKDISFWTADDSKVDGYSCGFSTDLYGKINHYFNLSGDGGSVETIADLRKKMKVSETPKKASNKTITEPENTPVPAGIERPATRAQSDYDEIFNTIVEYMEQNNRG